MNWLSFLLGFFSCFTLFFLLLLRFDIILRLLNIDSRYNSKEALKKFKKTSIIKIPNFTDNEDIKEETAHWINSILQYILYGIVSPTLSGQINIVKKINNRVNKINLGSSISKFCITDLNLGRNAPVFSNMVTKTSEDTLEFTCDILWQSDGYISIALDICINILVEQLAVLPIELCLGDIKMAFSLYFKYSLSTQNLEFSLLKSPVLDFQLQSEIGYKMPLIDIPHLRILILKAFNQIANKYIFPNTFAKQILQPRKNIIMSNIKSPVKKKHISKSMNNNNIKHKLSFSSDSENDDKEIIQNKKPINLGMRQRKKVT